ncbi:MAG: carbohydrate binding domain-containing protein, partial [Elusimicrobiota bacterium]
DNAAPWQIATADATPGCSVDAVKCTKVDYTNSVGGWGGFYLQFTAAKDLSAYSKLCLYIKGAVGGEKLKLGMVDSNDPPGSALSKVNLASYITISTSWQRVEIPFTDFTILDKTIVTQPFIIAFEDAYTAANATVYIDYIGFE